MKSVTKSATITATALNRQSGQLLYRVGVKGEHVFIERDGFPLAVIVPIGDYTRSVKRVSASVNKPSGNTVCD